jgi:signal transduction histidine kinase
MGAAMRNLRFLYSFRMRLLFVLAALLVGTLGLQYYLNSRLSRRRAVVIAEQEQALAASTALALESINSGEYLYQLDERRPEPFLKEREGRVINVLVINAEGRVDDSLDRRYAPTAGEDGATRYARIADVPLPKLVEAGQTTNDIRRLLPASFSSERPLALEPRAFPIPVRTNRGVSYIIVVLGRERLTVGDSVWRALRRLLPTLIALLVATLGAAVLIISFTRPIDELSDAARRVAAGDFAIRAPSAARRDEIGALSSTFNEMVAELGHMRELEIQIKQAEQSAVIGRLASAIAHEIRNPLNYINLTLDHLRTSLSPADEQKRKVVERLTDQLKAEVARINTRITEFLKYTRPASLELRALDLRELVADSLRMVEVQADESGVETRMEADAEARTVVFGDAESLRSLFTNLIINGMQAMEGAEGGRLTVGLTSEDGRARVRISDTGRGIAPENVSQIFEPYFSTKETGTGLGLAIAKKSVEDHGGTISVESRPGEGTTFTVALPLKPVISDG